MPKKLNISSNERVDLVDFNRASAEYTQESLNFDRQKLLQARRSLVSGGFRIEIADQVANPGQFTIYNGVGIDRDGNILNNEQQIDDARTLTLSGVGTAFYIEVEFVETQSDVDGRAFWDPTFSGNTPPGKEFSISVATRLTPDWQLTTPPSTSDFDIVANVSSNRIPIAVLTTNGSNQISGFTAVNISTVLEEDAGSADTVIRVLDSTLFPTTGTLTVDGVSRSITANDRANGLITISAGIGTAKPAGSIVVETGVTAAFVPMSTDPSPVTGAAGDEDRRRRVFAGDEVRGSALSANPEDGAARSDLMIQSLKDHVDYLAAQMRELKFGSLRSDETSTAPPSSFTSTRHYDAAGSVTGARAFAVSIGDGTNSYGDYNNSVLTTALNAAHDALDASDGGSIFVKKGTYTWGTVAFETDRPTYVVFEEGVVFTAGTYTNFAINVSTADPVKVFGFPAPPATVDACVVTSGVTALYLTFEECYLRLELSGTGTNSSLVARDCILEGSSLVEAIDITFDTAGDKVVFENCNIRYNDTVADTNIYLVSHDFQNTLFSNCVFDIAYNTATTRGFVVSTASAAGNVTFRDCEFMDTNTGKANNPFDLVGGGKVTFDSCVFDVQWDTAAASTPARTLLELATDDAVIKHCNFAAIATNTIGNTSAGNEGHIVYLSNCRGVIDGNIFGLEANSADIPHYVSQVTVYGGNWAGTSIVNNTFSTFYKAISSILNSASVNVSNNRFKVNTNVANATKSSYGVYIDESEGFTVAGNFFEMFLLDGTGTLECKAIYVSDTEEHTITGNTIKLKTDIDDCIAIHIAPTGGTETRSLISGNSIQLETSNGANTSPTVGIWLDVNAGLSSFVTISSNRMWLYTTGLGSLVGINQPGADLAGTNSGSTITGNNISLLSDSSVNDASGIRIIGNQTLISDNMVVIAGDSSATPSTLSFGIYAYGSDISISNNTVKSDDLGCNSSIFMEAFASTGNLKIDGNTIDHHGNSPAIGFLNNNTNIHLASISNNNIRWAGSGAYSSYTGTGVGTTNPMVGIGIYSGIYVVRTIQVANNNIHVETAPTGSRNWQAIRFSSGASNFRSIVLSSNCIVGPNSSQLFGADANPIRIDGCHYASIIGNSIYEWSISVTGYSMIKIISGVSSSVVGNTMDAWGTPSEASISLGSLSGGCVVGNVDRDGDGTISGGSNIILDSGTYNKLV